MIKVTESNRDSVNRELKDSPLTFHFYRNLCVIARPCDNYVPRDSNLKSIKYIELEDYFCKNNLSLNDVIDYCIETAYLDILSENIE